jgi:phage shock protein A
VSDSRQIRDFIPVINHINVENLNDPIAKALRTAPNDNLPQLINNALTDIRTAWNDIQPQYQEALAEMKSWHQVAINAMKQNREDLAREALKRKQTYKQRARELEADLKKLATLTEDLVQQQTQL